MSMTVKQIIDHSITLNGGTPIDLMAGRRWINECMDILAERYDAACVKDTVNVNCTDILIDYPLPSACLGVLDVKDSKGFKINANTYTANKYNEITFDNTGNYNIVYIRPGKLPTRELYDIHIGDDIPEVNPSYHRSIAYYVAALSVPLNDPRMAAYMNESNNLAEKVSSKLNQNKRKQRRIKPPSWR